MHVNSNIGTKHPEYINFCITQNEKKIEQNKKDIITVFFLIFSSFITNKDANTIKGAINVESFIVIAKVENINNIIKYFSNLKLSKVSVNFKK
tara:strand:+ start:1128 stop:1406 length:279 start_codon:yes stop_codon:yes gene_type:complete